MRLYLAGPMRNRPFFNAYAFNDWAARLREQGHEVFNPVEEAIKKFGDIYSDNPDGDEKQHKEKHGVNTKELFWMDLGYICTSAEAIALMPGWRESKGATAEHAVAIAIGLKVVELEEPDDLLSEEEHPVVLG